MGTAQKTPQKLAGLRYPLSGVLTETILQQREGAFELMDARSDIRGRTCAHKLSSGMSRRFHRCSYYTLATSIRRSGRVLRDLLLNKAVLGTKTDYCQHVRSDAIRALRKLPTSSTAPPNHLL